MNRLNVFSTLILYLLDEDSEQHTWEEHLVGILGTADEVSAEGEDDDDNDE